MGKNKKAFLTALLQMKQFLLGATLVFVFITLGTVMPAFGQLLGATCGPYPLPPCSVGPNGLATPSVQCETGKMPCMSLQDQCVTVAECSAADIATGSKNSAGFPTQQQPTIQQPTIQQPTIQQSTSTEQQQQLQEQQLQLQQLQQQMQQQAVKSTTIYCPPAQQQMASIQECLEYAVAVQAQKMAAEEAKVKESAKFDKDFGPPQDFDFDDGDDNSKAQMMFQGFLQQAVNPLLTGLKSGKLTVKTAKKKMQKLYDKTRASKICSLAGDAKKDCVNLFVKDFKNAVNKAKKNNQLIKAVETLRDELAYFLNIDLEEIDLEEEIY